MLLPLTDLESSGQNNDSANINDFLAGLFETPEFQQVAYEYYQKAKDRPDFKPEKSTLDHVVRYLVQAQNWGAISVLCDDFKVYDVVPHSVTCCGLISDCVEARKVRIVENLLRVFQSREVAVLAFYTAMRDLNKIHMFNSTIAVYQQMNSARIDLDPGGYFRVMEAYSRMKNASKVIELFEEFNTKSFPKTHFSAPIFTLACESLCKLGRGADALECFREMKKKGIRVHASVYSSLVSCFASIRQVEMAEELLEEAKTDHRTLRDPDMYLKLVVMYVEEGILEKTLDIIGTMKTVKLKVSDCISCTIINGFAKKRGYLSAAQVYDELISQGCEPGQVTYAASINTYCKLGLHEKAEEVFSEMEKKGFDRCVVAYSSILSMYGKTGRPGEAMRLLGKMKARGCRPNVWIYNSLMDMHGRGRNLRQVEKLWKEMKRRNVGPDKVSYTTLISAYNKAREFERCVEFYHEYRNTGGSVDRAMGAIMVGVFSKSGRVDELVMLLRDMKSAGTTLDGRLYRSALNALRDAGLQNQAEWLQQGSPQALEMSGR